MKQKGVISQIPILFKLDSHQLELLDDLCVKLGVKRNKLLNFFVMSGIKGLSEPKNFILTSIYSNIEF